MIGYRFFVRDGERIKSLNGNRVWPAPVNGTPGAWVEHVGPIELCVAGLHASPTIYDALQNAQGCEIGRIEADVVEAEDTNKFAARRMRIVELYSQEHVVGLGALAAAMVLHHFEAACPKDDRPRQAILACLRWLRHPAAAIAAAAWAAASADSASADSASADSARVAAARAAAARAAAWAASSVDSERAAAANAAAWAAAASAKAAWAAAAWAAAESAAAASAAAASADAAWAAAASAKAAWADAAWAAAASAAAWAAAGWSAAEWKKDFNVAAEAILAAPISKIAETICRLTGFEDKP